MPAYSAFPPNTCAKLSLSTSAVSKPSIAATSGDQASNVGAVTGVGITGDQAAPSTSRRRGPDSGSPGRVCSRRLSKRGLSVSMVLKMGATAALLNCR